MSTQETQTINEKSYLAGPMTGYPEFNIPAFRAAKVELDKLGFNIALPVDIDNADQKEGWQWGDYLAEDIRLICNECDSIVLLPEWNRSRGAKLEVAAGLMQSLKFPEFRFWYYEPAIKKASMRSAAAIAAVWSGSWSYYSKEAAVAA